MLLILTKIISKESSQRQMFSVSETLRTIILFQLNPFYLPTKTLLVPVQY